MEFHPLFNGGNEHKGIPSFLCSSEDFRKYFDECTTIKDLVHSKDSSLILKCHFDIHKFIKLIGLWDWVYNNCPNKRVTYFMRCGKNDRIKNKNFKRALEILLKEINS